MARLNWPKRTAVFLAAATRDTSRWFTIDQIGELLGVSPNYAIDTVGRWNAAGLLASRFERRWRAVGGIMRARRMRTFRPSDLLFEVAAARARPAREDERNLEPARDRQARNEAAFAERIGAQRYEDVAGARARPFVRLPSPSLQHSTSRSSADMCAES